MKRYARWLAQYQFSDTHLQVKFETDEWQDICSKFEILGKIRQGFEQKDSLYIKSISAPALDQYFSIQIKKHTRKLGFELACRGIEINWAMEKYVRYFFERNHFKTPLYINREDILELSIQIAHHSQLYDMKMVVLDYHDREELKSRAWDKYSDLSHYHRFLEGLIKGKIKHKRMIIDGNYPDFKTYVSWKKTYPGWSYGKLNKSHAAYKTTYLNPPMDTYYE